LKIKSPVLQEILFLACIIQGMAKLTPEQWWHSLLTGNDPALPVRNFRQILKLIPTGPRCKFCNAPYHGVGAPLMRAVGKGPSRLTPQLCVQCHSYASRYLGGAEVELTMLFADVRGSTALAEKSSPTEFGALISRFFATASRILIDAGALLDRLAGDQALGLFIPGFAGQQHKQLAIQAARDLLKATGHGQAEQPWIPLGIGIHTGVAFVGSVGNAGVATDITVLGDAANTAARLSSSAAAGEILISENALVTGLDGTELESRTLQLKGKSEPVRVYVLKNDPERVEKS
jgi:adenylate cyclase